MKKPEELVAEIERSILGKALLVSILAHAVLLVGTSSQLFADWTKYGVHSPSYINGVKTQERKDAETAERKAAAEKKTKEEAAKAAAGGTNKTAQVTAQVKTVAASEVEQKTPPEVKPLPPKKDFEYGEDLSLD